MTQQQHAPQPPPLPPPPYAVRLDPATARSFAVNGATILLLDVPEGTPIGLDQQVRVVVCVVDGCRGTPHEESGSESTPPARQAGGWRLAALPPATAAAAAHTTPTTTT
jgi:hypothetical protein